MNALALLAVPALPLLLAAVMAFRPRPWLQRLTPWTTLPALWLAVTGSDGQRVSADWLLMGVELALDPLGRSFLLLTASLWLAAGLYTLSDRQGDPQARRFHLFFLLAMSGNLGLVLAADAVGFYLFFSLMSLASWGLVIHRENREAWRAGRVYLVTALIGELVLFAGLVLSVVQTGSSRMADIAAAGADGWALVFLVAGLGVKAGMLPLHFWLPLAHPAAPVPASAVLSGAMIKAGLLGWLRLLPQDPAGSAGLGETLVVLGFLGAFLAAVGGVLQERPKTILAYSSISQIGLMTVGVGLALLLPEARAALVAAVAFYALHHGLAKGALFLSVGIVDRLPSAAFGRYVTIALLILPALAVAGLPLTSGALAKSLLTAPLIAELALVKWGFSLAMIGSTVLMIRFLWCLRASAAIAAGPPDARRWWPWAVLASMSVVLPPAMPIAGVGDVRATADDLLGWSLAWPVLAGLVLAFVAARIYRQRHSPRLPEGDLEVPLERVVIGGARLASRLRRVSIAPRLRARGRLWRRRGRGFLRRAENALIRWDVFGALFLGLTLFLYGVLTIP